LSNLATRRRSAGSALRADIIGQINEGKLRPGDAIRSAASLAEEYGISYVTAHRVFRKLVKEGYCVRVGGKGTFVSDNPPTSKVTFVGIPAYHQANPFHAHMIEELTAQGAARRIYAVVGRGERTRDFIDRMVASGIKAMIRFPGAQGAGDLHEVETWKLLQEKGIRTVMINDFWHEGGPFPHVRTDEAAGISEMMDHLISLGHKRILLVMEAPMGTRPTAVQTHRRALVERGLPYDPRWVISLFPEWSDNKEGMLRRMLKQATAAVAIYDIYAVELATELRRLGVVLGRDFSLAGFDGIPEAEALGISTVVQPVPELASRAYSLLARSNTSEVPKELVKPTCAFRESTGPAPKGR